MTSQTTPFLRLSGVRKTYPGVVALAGFAPRHWSPGSVISRQDARVASEQGGRVVEVVEVGERIRAGQALAVLFIDCHRFRLINEKYGHEFGDLMLIEAAHRLKNMLPEEALACRRERRSPAGAGTAHLGCRGNRAQWRAIPQA